MGMKTVLEQTYPKAHFQRRLVHVMRNICAKVRVDDRETIMNEFKQIHQQPNKEAAIKVLHAFYDKLNLICWSFTAILSRSGLQFIPLI